MITKKITFVIAIIAIYSNAFGQITFNGNSSYTYTDVGGPAPTCSPGEVYYNGTPNDSQFSTTGNCMTLTDGSTGANSGMWVGVCDVLDLTNDFVVCFDADFGSNNGSGDGIAFVLNGTGSVAPFPGEGGFIGYGNNGGDVVGIEFDSFADGDIGCHHSEINYGGINGTQLSSPIPLEICCGSIIGSGSNSICIYWEVSSGTTGTLTAVYNGQVVAEYTGDLGGLVGTNPQWGFTAGANASGQVQTVCNVNMDNQLATNGSPSFTCAYLDASNFSATPDPATLCEGNCLNIALSGPAGSSFCWVADDNINVNGESLTVQTGSTIDDCPTNDDFNPGGPPTYPNDQVITYTIAPSAGGCVGESFQVTVNLLDELNPICACTQPIVTATPNPESICSGGTTSITLTSSEASTTYEWSAIDNPNVSGASTTTQSGTTISETLINISSIDQVVTYTVTPSAAGCVGNPIIVNVTVKPIPTITNAILTEEFCSGGTTGIVPTADVAGTTFSWTAVGSSVNVTGFSASGSGNISETLTNSGTAVETVTYTVTPIGPGTPTCPGIPVDFVVTVNPVPTITNVILTEEFCSGGTTGIVPTADVAGTTFTWTAVGSSGNVTGFSASGSGNISETLTNIGTAIETVTYTVTPLGPGTPTCPGTAVDFVVTVNPVPTITNAILTEEFCSLGTTAIVPTADVTGTTFTWTAVGSSGNVTGFSGSGSGNISETLTNSGTAVETVTYTVTPIGPGTPTCPGTPVDFVVTVNPVPTITNAILTEELCSGGTTGILPTADVAGTTFTWTAVGSSVNVTGFSATGSGNISETLTNSGTAVETVTYTVNPVGPGTPTCLGTPVDFVVTVNPFPTITNVILTEEFCSGGTTGIVPSADVAGTTLTWTAVGSSGNVTGFSASGSGNISETLTNSGTAFETVTYTVTPIGPGTPTCPGTPVDFVVTVNPVPTITNAILTEELCSGGTTGILPTADVAGTTFTWTAVGSSVNVTGFSATGSGNISETLTNSGTAVETVTYTVNPVGPGTPTCLGTPVDFVVTVNPFPTITNVILTEEFCSGGTTGIVPTADVAGTTLTWIAVGSSGNVTGFSASGSGNISETLTNSGTAVETVAYTVTPIGPGTPTCPGSPVDFVVTVNPIPTLAVQDSTGCSPFLLNLTNPTYWNSDIGTLSYFTDPGLSSPVVDPTAVGPGTYYIQADNIGCSSTAPVTVTETASPVIATVVSDPTICNATDGSIEVTLSSGATSLGTLNWTGTAIGTNGTADITVDSPDIAGLGAGSYNVTFTDANGCVSNTELVVLNNPGAPIIGPISDTVSCADYDLVLANVTGTNLNTTGALSFYTLTGGPLAVGQQVITDQTFTAFTDTTIFVYDESGACSAEIQFDITINTTPTLLVQDSTTCSPNTVELSDMTYWSSDVGIMTWYSDAGLSSILPSTNAGAGTYYVEADNFGCTSNGQVIVTVNTTPTLALQDTTVCSPATVDITDVTYWSSDIGTLSYFESDGTTPMTTQATAGAGTYVISANNAGCITTGNVTVTVNTTPTLTLADPAPVCSPATVDITAGAVSSTDVGTMAYYSDAGLSILVPDPTTVGAGTYYIEATNLSCTSNGSVTVVVNITPTLTLADPAAVCSPLTVDITVGAVSSTDVGTMLYYSDVAMTILVPDATAVGNGIYYVEATNLGCTSNGSVTVTVVTTPDVDTQTPVEVCDSYELPIITGAALSGAQNYFDATGGPTVANIVTGPITSSTTLFVYDGASGCSDEETLLITINPLPSVTLVSGGDTYCEGEAVSEILVDVTGTGNFTVDYTLDGAALSTSGTTNPLSLGNAAGVYIITNITDGTACTNGANGSQTIVVNPIPSAPLAGSDSEYCSTVDPNLMTASGGGGILTWYSDAALTNILGTGTTLNPSIGLGVTTYYVTETEFGCEGPTSQVVISINGCEITIPTAFTPDGDGMNDDWEILDIDKTYPNNIVYVYNRWGNLLFTSVQGDYDNNRWDGTYKELSLPVGSYYFIIHYNDKANETETGTVSIILNK